MRIRTLSFTLLILTFFASVEAEGYDKEKLLEEFQSAIADGNQEDFERLIIVSEDIKQEHAKALAVIYTDLLGKRLQQVIMNNAEKVKKINKRRVNPMMAKTMPMMLANPVFILENGKMVSRNDKRLIEAERNGMQSLILSDIDGQTKFWPSNVDPSDDLIELGEFLNEYKSVIENSTINDIETNFDALVSKYIDGTSLEFKNQEIEARIRGEKAPISSVVITYGQFMGKDVIKINFLQDEMNDKCGKFQPSSFAIDLPNTVQKVYDFQLLGINGNLIKTNLSVNVKDGKIELIKIDENTYKGRIAAEKDENNYIYGSFTAILCQ